MIGVITQNKDRIIIEELFELFKTPWEFYRSGNYYSTIIVNSKDTNICQLDAQVVIIFGYLKFKVDTLLKNELEKETSRNNGIKLIELGGTIFPIYGTLAQFKSNGVPISKIIDTNDIVGVEHKLKKKKILRLGYDLVYEIRRLLTLGQPNSLAKFPTLEIHISNLRNWILESGSPLVEIPPVPAGYDFIACLTHDVDYIGIRKHIFDYTFFGFLYRGVIGSIINYFKKVSSLKKLLYNWFAVLKLPLVYINMCPDFWFQLNRYNEIEKNIAATYFFIPFKNKPGKKKFKLSPRKRAAKYDVADIHDEIKKLKKNGHEIGLHGIDAWNDKTIGLNELKRISEITEFSDIGVRIHWLYYNDKSPKNLEEAGFLYDSSIGYNDTIGFKAGTAQVYRPIDASKILELPLIIQDTALFYPRRMNLSEVDAWQLIRNTKEKMIEYGGVLTINWHQRSLAPERLWEDFYIRLLDSLKMGKTCFEKGNEIVGWFKKRRAVVFNKILFDSNGVHVKISSPGTADPEFMLKIYHPNPNRKIKNRKFLKVTNMSFSGSIDRFIQYSVT